MRRATNSSFDGYDNKYEISRERYVKIAQVFGKVLSDTLVETGYTIDFPYHLGAMFVQKFKPKKNYINARHFFNTGEKIIHKNKHTNGWVAKVHYLPIRYVPNSMLLRMFNSDYIRKKLYRTILKTPAIMHKYFMPLQKK